MRILKYLLALAPCLLTVALAAQPAADKTGDPFTGRTPEQIKKKLAEIGAAPDGKEDKLAAERSAALRRLKQYRYLAGVPYDDLVLDPEMERMAQAASRLCEKLGRLDHAPKENPGLPEEDYQLGRKGAGASNLAEGQPNYRQAVDDWMFDSDAGNVERLGHRRWCLNPALKKLGFGVSGNFYAMYCFDRSRKPPPDFDYVSWPARAPMPAEFFRARSAWSVSPNPQKYQPSKEGVKVSVREADADGKPAGEPLKLAYQGVNTDGYGVPFCVIFRPENVAVADGKRYRVELDGLKRRDGKAAPALGFVVEFVSVK